MRVKAVQQDHRIVAALNAEWTELQTDHREDVHQWAARYPALTHCGDLEQVLGAIRTDADGVLFALLTQSGTGDRLAARVVLQAMLGKVVNLSVRDPQASEHDYLVALWCRIATYPLASRPRRIAANLALDTLKTVHQERARTPPGVAVTPMAEEQLFDRLHAGWSRSHTGSSDADAVTATGVITTADRLGLIDVATRDVLLSVYAEGLSGRAAADRHGTTPGMVRFRCSRAVRRLAAHSASLSEAA